MMNHESFQILLLNGRRLWPASVYSVHSDNGECSLKDLSEIRKQLEQEGEIFIQAFEYDYQNDRLGNIGRNFTKEELHFIQGPIRVYDSQELSINEVFGLSEAARLWGIDGGGATIRKAYERGQFKSGEIRKSDGILLVTYPGMQRRFNALMKSQYEEIPIYIIHEGYRDEVLLLGAITSQRSEIDKSRRLRKGK
ncbi:hypothetical protein ABE82_25965 (plasmid) [Paenibacillus peoriae]|uniref:helix-turn-helix domain-containing protein n=1 Tax=Paenibacillus peoriae TaxID=59893 RepID=UPI000721BFAB|nr:helix-turn-helix domain-containing protein [Paenibacillus peoriae]ALS09868.1 hypothetical protein ABE82_25965 [Paenibacillus peoriae]